MTSNTFQLITLAAAYVVVVSFATAQAIFTVLSYRLQRRLDTRRSVETRVTTLEAEVRSQSDLLDRFVKRWSKRDRDGARAASRRQSTDDGELDSADGDAQATNLRAQLESEWSQRARSGRAS